MVAGYGVFGVAFESGDILALRRFPTSSVGPGYTSVWHRTPRGEWSILADAAPGLACPRYFGTQLASSLRTPIDINWTGPRSLTVTIDGRLRWEIGLRPSAGTRVLNAMGRLMPDSLWRSPRAMGLLARMAGPMLRAGSLTLTGTTPNGQWFLANPRLVWRVVRSEASWEGRDLGRMVRLDEVVALGGFRIPRAPLFSVGRTMFEAYQAGRHSSTTQSSRTRHSSRNSTTSSMSTENSLRRD